MMSFNRFRYCVIGTVLFFSILPVQPLSANSKTSPFLLPPEDNESATSVQSTLTANELQKKGTKLAQAGKLEEAEIMLARSLEADPSNLKTLNNLGLVVRKLGKLDEALQAYYLALQFNDQYALPYKNIGVLLETLQEQELAADAYKRYCTLLPDAPDAYRVAARADWLESQTSTSATKDTEEERLDKYMAENALEWQEVGARLFAKSVVEKNKEILFNAIEYLELAATGLPENKGITVDLADAYMETHSRNLTALAIDLYESVFDSFSEDPLLARLVDAYSQLQNFKVAFALAQQRMTTCPMDKRRIAAVQMSFVAISSQQEKAAIATINKDMQQRGDDPVLKLTIAVLNEAQGEIDAALAIAFNLLADKSLEPDIRSHVGRVKNQFLGDDK